MNVLFITKKSEYESRMSCNHNWLMKQIETKYDVIDESEIQLIDIKKYDIIVSDTWPDYTEQIQNYKGNRILLGKFHQDLWQLYERKLTNIDSEYDFVINRYNDPKVIDGIICKDVKRYYIPHHQDFSVYKDWGLEKEYDMILYGNDWRQLYPFRWRLFKFLKQTMCNTDEFTTRVIPHPGYSDQSAKNAIRTTELSKEINKSWLCLCTSESHGPFGKYKNPYGSWYSKYMESSLSGAVIIGTMPDEAKEVYQDDYIDINVHMDNYTILNKIRDALEDKQKLKDMASRVIQRYKDAKMDIPNYTNKLNDIFTDVLQTIGKK